MTRGVWFWIIVTWVTAFICAGMQYAPAQEASAGIVPLPAINWTLSKNLSIYAGGPFAVISEDGQVSIDWDRAEKTVATPEKTDAMTLALARLILAVRDGSWKPLGDAK